MLQQKQINDHRGNQLGLVQVLAYFMVLFSVGILPFSLLFACIRWRDIRGSYFVDAASWPTTRGTILRSRTYSETYAIEGQNSTFLHYSIEYKFSVDHRTYYSNQITFYETGFSDPSIARSYVTKYPVGHEVTVFYDPRNHALSVLEPNVRENFFLLFVELLVGTSLLLFWVLRGLKTDKWSIM